MLCGWSLIEYVTGNTLGYSHGGFGNNTWQRVMYVHSALFVCCSYEGCVEDHIRHCQPHLKKKTTFESNLNL